MAGSAKQTRDQEKNSQSRSRSTTGARAGRSAAGAGRGTRSAPGSTRGIRSASRSASGRSSTGTRSQSGTGTRKRATASRAGTTRRSTSGTRARARTATPGSRSDSTGRSTTRRRAAGTTSHTRSTSTRSSARPSRAMNALAEEVGSRRVLTNTPEETSDHVHPVVVGIFAEPAQAECAEKELRRAGFKENQIGVAMRDEGKRNARTEGGEQGNRAGQGAAKGLVAGGVVGGLLGAAAAMLLPGVGPVLAGGILATTAAGAATGAVAGGILGSLVGLGIPVEEARYYEQQFEAGRIIMTARANGRHDEATRILRSCGSYDVHHQRVATDEQIRLESQGDEAKSEEPYTTSVTTRTEISRATGKRA